ncbi:MAG: hypothetical protein ACI9ON_001320 [Limisphaerales bacterium]|jgi:hypothetical protein
MHEFYYPGILSCLALLTYYFTLFKAGMARGRFGVLWPVGRLWYALGYYKSADQRSLGLYLSMPPIYIFIVGSLIGFVLKLV